MSSNLKPWLLLAVIFIVGVVTGVALTIGLGPHFMRPPGELLMKRHWMAELVQRLNLTADQQAKIEPIVADATTQLQSVHRDEMARGAQIFKSAHDQISALLTPEQQVELQKMESERVKRFSDHMRPWGPPHDGMMPPPPPSAPTNAAPGGT